MMNTQTMIMILVLMWFAMAVFGSYKLRKQIRCRYTSKSKQSYEKFVKSDTGTVLFEKKPFYIFSSCVTHHWKNYAILFWMFMPEISFTWESQYPIDPNTGKIIIVDPQTKSLMRSQENMASYAGSQQAAVLQGRKAGGMLERLMPIIAIIAVVVSIYAAYTVTKIQSNDKITQQAIIDIYNTFNQHGMPVIPLKGK